MTINWYEVLCCSVEDFNALRWSHSDKAPDLSGADLVKVNLCGADLGGVNLVRAKLPEGVPVVESIDAAILEAIADDGELDMSAWHGDSCEMESETTHSRAGWAIHLAGAAGYALQSQIGAAAAGGLIYAASRPDLPVPDFDVSNTEALADIRACAARARKGKR